LSAADSPTIEGSTAALGKLLFTQYVLPFEVVSILLLVAMMGVILLSKKDAKAVPPSELGLPEINVGNEGKQGGEKSELIPVSSRPGEAK
jgi:hypothetical protein